MTFYTLEWGRYRLELGRRTRIMGVLNITPDSFSDGGDFYSFDKAVARGVKLAADGADILDIGGESTRPYSEPVSVEQELGRVLPVIEALSNRIDIPISIDTTKAAVAEKAVRAGASIINDVSSLRTDPRITDVAVEHDLPIILMHMKGTPKTMQVSPTYDNLLEDIASFLEERVEFAQNRGIERSKIIIDPGIGFGKTFEHNFKILNNLKYFDCLKLPILVGSSRKAFIRHTLNGNDISAQSAEVETGTQATVSAAVLNGAHMVRVHEVAGTCTTLKIIDAVKSA